MTHTDQRSGHSGTEFPGSEPFNTINSGSYRVLREQLLQFARHLAAPDIAEDLVQEAFLSVLRRGAGVPRGEDGLPQLAYLCTTVRNALVDRIRHERIRHRRGGQTPPAENGGGLSSIDLDEMRGRLAGALPRLSQRQWQAAVLTTLGLTTEQAAASIGGSREAVCGSRDRAIRELRESLPKSSAGIRRA